MKIIYIGFLLRVFIALYNGYVEPSFGAENDASKFHESAVFFANGENDILHEKWGSFTYVFLIGTIYKYTFSSYLLGCLISCFIWLVSAIFLLKITNLLKFKQQNIFFCLTIYSLIPSSIMFTSVTLREPIQLLLVNWSYYFLVKFFLENKKKSTKSLYFLNFLIPFFLLALFHRAFVIFTTCAFTLIILFLLFYYLKKFYNKKILFISISLTVPLFAYFFNTAFGIINISFDKNIYFTITDLLPRLLNDHDINRATYAYDINFLYTSDILVYFYKSFINYQLQPFPSVISNFSDFVVFSENILRFYLIIICSFYIFVKNVSYKFIFSIFFFTYILLEFIWGLGTVNYGTGIRHHIPGMGLILICYFNLNLFDEKK